MEALELRLRMTEEERDHAKAALEAASGELEASAAHMEALRRQGEAALLHNTELRAQLTDREGEAQERPLCRWSPLWRCSCGGDARGWRMLMSVRCKLMECGFGNSLLT